MSSIIPGWRSRTSATPPTRNGQPPHQNTNEPSTGVGAGLGHRPNETTLEVPIFGAGGETGDLELFEPARIERDERPTDTGVIQRDAIDHVAVRLLGGATPHLIRPRAGCEGNDRREVVPQRQRRQLCLIDAGSEPRVLAIDGVGSRADDHGLESRGCVAKHDVDLGRLPGCHCDAFLGRRTEAEASCYQGVLPRGEQTQAVSAVDSRDIASDDRSIAARRRDDGAGDRRPFVAANVSSE